jgi:hypothetical protein
MATLSAVDIEDAGLANMVFDNDTSVIVARPGELTKWLLEIFVVQVSSNNNNDTDVVSYRP